MTDKEILETYAEIHKVTVKGLIKIIGTDDIGFLMVKARQEEGRKILLAVGKETVQLSKEIRKDERDKIVNKIVEWSNRDDIPTSAAVELSLLSKKLKSKE